MKSYPQLLEDALTRGRDAGTHSALSDAMLVQDISLLCDFKTRAYVRALIACALGKAFDSTRDVRKPYVQIEGAGAFSARAIDEKYIDPFIQRHTLPLTKTTAFLTPVFRDLHEPLTMPKTSKVNPAMAALCRVLQAIEEGRVNAMEVLIEAFRGLLIIKEQRALEWQDQLSTLASNGFGGSLSASISLALLSEHLQQPRSSRLPVLAIAAALHGIGEYKVATLEDHFGADNQTGAAGDVEVRNAQDVIQLAVEVKARQISISDVGSAFEKAIKGDIDSYLIITTKTISQEVAEFASELSLRSGGRFEMNVQELMPFLKVLFVLSEVRRTFLDRYQELLLNEPDSAVSHELKMAFIRMRAKTTSEATEHRDSAF